MKHYRLSVSGEAVTKIVGFDSPDSKLYFIANAHNLLKSGDFSSWRRQFLKNAVLKVTLTLTLLSQSLRLAEKAGLLSTLQESKG